MTAWKFSAVANSVCMWRYVCPMSNFILVLTYRHYFKGRIYSKRKLILSLSAATFTMTISIFLFWWILCKLKEWVSVKFSFKYPPKKENKEVQSRNDIKSYISKEKSSSNSNIMAKYLKVLKATFNNGLYNPL